MLLSTILSEIEKNQPLASTEVASEPASTYRGRIGQKRAAEEAIKRLKFDYRNALMSSTLFIVVTGPSQDQFSKTASGSFGCFTADPDSLFKELASKINPTLYGREGTKHLFSIAENVLYDKLMELGIMSHEPFYFNEKYNVGVKSADEFALLLRRAITDQLGPELVGVNAVDSIVDTALKNKHGSDVTPIVLNTSDEKFALDLYNNVGRINKVKAFLVSAGKPSKTLQAVKDVVVVKNVNEESVFEALTAIRDKT